MREATGQAGILGPAYRRARRRFSRRCRVPGLGVRLLLGGGVPPSHVPVLDVFHLFDRSKIHSANALARGRVERHVQIAVAIFNRFGELEFSLSLIDADCLTGPNGGPAGAFRGGGEQAERSLRLARKGVISLDDHLVTGLEIGRGRGDFGDGVGIARFEKVDASCEGNRLHLAWRVAGGACGVGFGLRLQFQLHPGDSVGPDNHRPLRRLAAFQFDED